MFTHMEFEHLQWAYCIKLLNETFSKVVSMYPLSLKHNTNMVIKDPQKLLLVPNSELKMTIIQHHLPIELVTESSQKCKVL